MDINSIFVIAFLCVGVYFMIFSIKFTLFCEKIATNEGRYEVLNDPPLGDGGFNSFEIEVVWRVIKSQYSDNQNEVLRNDARLMKIHLIVSHALALSVVFLFVYFKT